MVVSTAAAVHLFESLHKARTMEDARALVERGDDVNGKDKEARTPLHVIVRHDNVEVAAFLLANGADVNAAMPRGWTPLHTAARHASIEMVKLLVENGADVNASMEHGLSVAHIAAEKGRVDVVEYLATKGVDMDAATWRGLSVLQIAVKQGSVDVAAFYLNQGYDVNTKTRGDVTLLHTAALEDKVEMVEFLLERGANVHATDSQNRTALHNAIWGQRAKRCQLAYPVIVMLCKHGATWDKDCEVEMNRRLGRAKKAAKRSSEIGDEVEIDKTTLWRLGVRESVQHWDRQRTEGVIPLSVIPMEAVLRGDDAVKTFLNSMQASRADELISRRKICVVGPSRWGKTSLVKSLTSSEPSLVHIDDRTIGIDIFAHTFTRLDSSNNNEVHHEITFWDFAGQDEYQVAHALFFSKRTLYLLCVDLEQYADMLTAMDNIVSAREAEHAMTRFLRANIFRWVRAIVTRQSDAEFLVVGTKRDRIEDEKLLQIIERDLRARLQEWMSKFAAEIDAECAQLDTQTTGDHSGEAPDSIAEFQSLKKRLTSLFAHDWIVVTSATKESIASALDQLEAKISSSDRSFVMPIKYTRVLDAIRSRRDAAARMASADRIANAIVPVRALCSALMREVEGLDADECRDILQMLHDLGDVLWYQQEASGVLRDTVIIDPTLVLDFVREVITHEYSDRLAPDQLSAKAVQEGRLPHAFLRQRSLWKEIDEELVFAFKQLLQFFQLAYPADNEEMDWDSDLIVPTYWKASYDSVDATPRDTRRLVAQKSMMQRRGVHAASHFCWEFELSAEVSETVFEHFAVQSYSSFLQRSLAPNVIETFVHGDCAALITLVHGDSSRDVITIEVAVADAALGWHHLRYYVMALETVLDGYPGLVVSRYIVDPMSNDLTRHRLSSALAALEDAVWLGKDVATVRATMPWLAQDMQWYQQKAWRQPGALQQLRTQELVRETVNKLDVLRKLVVADDARRRYPALWTFSFDPLTKKIALRMLSDLSGDCFHDPIEIAAPPAFLAKHGSVLQAGLSILSNVVPAIVSLGVIQKVVDLVATAVENKVGRATTIYNMIDQLDLASGGVVQSTSSQRLSPRGAVLLLRELLQLHDESFDELHISDLSKLQCAATSDGHFIWAHRQEIMVMGEKLTPCDPDDMRLLRRTLSGSSTNSFTSTAPSSAAATEDSSLRLRLSIIGVNGLSAWDWRKTYCKWQLVHPSSSTQLAAGSTAPHSDSAVPPPWSDVEFALRNVASIDMLRVCLLVVHVKRPSRCLGIVKLVGEGVVSLGAFVPANSEPCEDAYAVFVPLGGDATRLVHCQLTTA